MKNKEDLVLKILLKAAVLFLIVISIYCIVHPAACSNLLAGREMIAPTDAKQSHAGKASSEQTQTIQQSGVSAQDGAFIPNSDELEIFDTNTMKQSAAQPTYSQQEIDYAIASYYVEQEREYARHHALGKDSSREISFMVMDTFQMSPAEWDAFLSRATASDLFNKVRQELPSDSAPAQ